MIRIRRVGNGLAVFAVTMVLAGTSVAQVRVDLRRPPEIGPRMLEAAVHLQLYAHPDTAHRDIEVRVRRAELELRGDVAHESERQTAERLAGLVAPDRAVVNRIRVANLRAPDAFWNSYEGPPAELERQYFALLRQEYPGELLEWITLSVYPVRRAATEPGGNTSERPSDPPSAASETTGWVVVLEGTVPSVREQFAMSERLLSGPPSAAAVVNRTYVARGYYRGRRPELSIRVPFFGMDLDVDDEGVDLGLVSPGGPLHIRTGGDYRPEDDEELLVEYMERVRDDPQLRQAPLRAVVLAGVITIEGKLRAADRMRAIALARGMRGLRGLVDRTATLEGGPPYYDSADLSSYLSHRLGEHADVWDVEVGSDLKEQILVSGAVPTDFHAALASSAVASDPALSSLPLSLEWQEWAGPTGP